MHKVAELVLGQIAHFKENFELLRTFRGLVLLCTFCQKNCYKAAKLLRHLRQRECHSQYRCNHCEMAFRITEDLLKHEEDVHKDAGVQNE